MQTAIIHMYLGIKNVFTMFVVSAITFICAYACILLSFNSLNDMKVSNVVATITFDKHAQLMSDPYAFGLYAAGFSAMMYLILSIWQHFGNNN